jgi:hypothetical protein
MPFGDVRKLVDAIGPLGDDVSDSGAELQAFRHDVPVDRDVVKAVGDAVSDDRELVFGVLDVPGEGGEVVDETRDDLRVEGDGRADLRGAGPSARAGHFSDSAGGAALRSRASCRPLRSRLARLLRLGFSGVASHS